MRALVVGAGVLGGYFGGRLLRAGKDVVFLVRPQRAAQLARDGLNISSPHGDFMADVRAHLLELFAAADAGTWPVRDPRAMAGSILGR